MEGEIIGQMAAVEFVEDDDEEGREAGTYITIRVPDGHAWRAGAVVVRYETDREAAINAE